MHLIKVRDGGRGLGNLEQCIVKEELSRACAGIALSYGAHSYLCLHQIAKNASEEQKAKYLPKVCSHRKLNRRFYFYTCRFLL